MVFQFKIQLQGITNPPVWRVVTIPADFTFLDFHEIIQIVFGWEDCHLFEFTNTQYRPGIRIALLPEDDFWNFGLVQIEDASEIKLSDIFKRKGRKFFYTYDMGDNWVHEIKLESISKNEQKTAICLSGEGACPPEDCGGIYGYEHIKEILTTTPQSEQADEYREWLGLEEYELWDANDFNIDKINDYLQEI